MIPGTARHFGAETTGRILDWFDREGRSFPWRKIEGEKNLSADTIHDPWLILVSEVMLQQTQASRVVEKLPEFLERFPTVESLARGSKADLLRAWQGMGYNSRALRLKKTAETIVDKYGGEFPRDPAALRSLPGIGRYTASAILCFAFGQQVPVVDVNIARVLSRIFFRCYTTVQRLREDDLYDLDEFLLPDGESYRRHQALMDFGAVICTARAPSCDLCPLNDLCLSARFPANVSLFDPATVRRAEPQFRGEPRRIWRGRIIEMMRGSHEGLIVDDLFDHLVEGTSPLLNAERNELLQILAGLRKDGLIERGGGVREGDLAGSDLIRLPV